MTGTKPTEDDAPASPRWCANCGHECYVRLADCGCEPRNHDWRWVSECCDADLLDAEPFAVKGESTRPSCLDLFCGAGGASMGLHRAGFDVTGVDIAPQPRYPFKFIQGDALAQDLTGFDFVWASPPCQGYCALKTMPNRREHPKLIEEVRDMLMVWGGLWIIENVEGAKNELRNPTMLCGSMFGLESNGFQLRRHRYFESNVPLAAPGPCRHAKRTLGVFGSKVRDIAQERRHYAQPKETRGKPVGVVLPQSWGFAAMGCDWMKIDEASEAIPPAYSEHLGRQVMAYTANGGDQRR